MKFGKKLISALALTLSATTLIACGAPNQKVTFKEYWFADANVTPSTVLEELVYDVEFEAASGLASNDYKVDYKNGEYKTKLTLTENVYRYETSLTIDVIYSVGSETLEKQDTMTSWVEMEKTAKLQPIASHKEFVSHTPANGGSSLETCFIKYAYSVDTTYDENGLGGKSVVVNNETEKTLEKTFTVEDKYTCLDNEQLLLALRGLSQSTTSAAISTYAPFSGTVQTLNVKFSSLAKGTEFTFERGGTSVKEVVEYYPVSLSINAQLPGATQTVWIAKTDNAQSNKNRNVILQLETPLSYNLGSLIYKLTSAKFI